MALAPKLHVYHYLFTLVLDFDFLILNLTVDKLSSSWGSCIRQLRSEKMSAGSPAWRFALNLLCSLLLQAGRLFEGYSTAGSAH